MAELTPFPTAMSEPTTAPETTEIQISEAEKIRAALNLPADQFKLGDRVFSIHDLPYDDYIAFVALSQPLVEVLINKVAGRNRAISVPGIELKPEDINIASIVTTLGKVLPDMVCLMCKQSDPTVTVAEVKTLGRTPFALAVAVFKQIKQNGMIRDFADFFVQLTTMLKQTQ